VVVWWLVHGRRRWRWDRRAWRGRRQRSTIILRIRGIARKPIHDLRIARDRSFFGVRDLRLVLDSAVAQLRGIRCLSATVRFADDAACR
jgi:hypothetical protein